MTTNTISRQSIALEESISIPMTETGRERERENSYCRWEAKWRGEEITRKVTLAEDENSVSAIVDVDR